MSTDTDAYQEEMINLRHNLYRNNYSERLTLAQRNLDRRIGNDTRKLTTVCPPYVKGLAERIQKICRPYDIRTIFTSDSNLWRYLFRANPPKEVNMTKSWVNHIPCSSDKVSKGDICHPRKVRLEEYGKTLLRSEIEKSSMADHICKENGNHQSLWDEAKIIDREEHWRIRRLKKSAHM